MHACPLCAFSFLPSHLSSRQPIVSKKEKKQDPIRNENAKNEKGHKKPKGPDPKDWFFGSSWAHKLQSSTSEERVKNENQTSKSVRKRIPRLKPLKPLRPSFNSSITHEKKNGIKREPEGSSGSASHSKNTKKRQRTSQEPGDNSKQGHKEIERRADSSKRKKIGESCLGKTSIYAQKQRAETVSRIPRETKNNEVPEAKDPRKFRCRTCWKFVRGSIRCRLCGARPRLLWFESKIGAFVKAAELGLVSRVATKETDGPEWKCLLCEKQIRTDKVSCENL